MSLSSRLNKDGKVSPVEFIANNFSTNNLINLKDIKVLRKFLVLSLLILAAGCNSEDLPSSAPSKVLEIKIDGESITLTDEEFSTNENCDIIFVSTSVLEKNGFDFSMSINITKSGHLSNIDFFDYSNNNKHYKGAGYISSEVFSIHNYKFSPLERTLSFDYDGTLYGVSDKEDTKQITGKVRVGNLPYLNCSYEPWKIKADINHSPFNMVHMWGTSSSDNAEWFGYSDDGIKISIITEDELKNMPTGTYSFNKDDLVNKVSIEKYIGTYKTSFDRTSPLDWESYQYEGELIIEEQLTSPIQTRGSFNLKAFKNNELIYEVVNGQFSI